MKQLHHFEPRISSLILFGTRLLADLCLLSRLPVLSSWSLNACTLAFIAFLLSYVTSFYLISHILIVSFFYSVSVRECRGTSDGRLMKD